MKFSIFIYALGFFFCGSLSGKIIHVEKLPSLSKLLCPLSGKKNPIIPHINRYKVLYETKDFFDNNTIASGLIAIPASRNKYLSPLLYLHATSSTKQNVPSMGSIESKFFACKTVQKKRVMIAPDYLGMGYHQGDHPYMISDITVKTSLDLLNSAVELLQENNFHIDENLILAGYSQGGHAALAVHKYLDFNPNPNYKIVKNFVMSGPTNLSTNMLQSMIYDEPSDNTSFFGALVIANYQIFYGDIYSNHAFKLEYQAVEQEALNINKKEIKKILPTNFTSALDEGFLDEVKFNSESSLKYRLSQSDIIPWQASAPIVLSYSKADMSIPPKDTFHFYQLMKSMGNDVSLRKSSNHIKHRMNFIPSVILMSQDLKNL